MFRSDELTQGKWPILLTLLAKSVIGGYVAGWLPFWVASWLSVFSVPDGFSWVLTVASIAAVAVVEPTMFIGFALLYTATSQSTAPSSTKALAHEMA